MWRVRRGACDERRFRGPTPRERHISHNGSICAVDSLQKLEVFATLILYLVVVNRCILPGKPLALRHNAHNQIMQRFACSWRQRSAAYRLGGERVDLRWQRNTKAPGKLCTAAVGRGLERHVLLWLSTWANCHHAILRSERPEPSTGCEAELTSEVSKVKAAALTIAAAGVDVRRPHPQDATLIIGHP